MTFGEPLGWLWLFLTITNLLCIITYFAQCVQLKYTELWRDVNISFDDTDTYMEIYMILSHLSWNHTWVERSQFCSNEGPCPLPRGDKSKIAKLYWQNLKLFSRTNGPMSTKHSWVMGILVCSNEGPCPFQKEDDSKYTLKTCISKSFNPELLG